MYVSTRLRRGVRQAQRSLQSRRLIGLCASKLNRQDSTFSDPSLRACRSFAAGLKRLDQPIAFGDLIRVISQFDLEPQQVEFPLRQSQKRGGAESNAAETLASLRCDLAGLNRFASGMPA